MKENGLKHIEKVISKTPLYSLLGAEGIDELRHRIIDIICEQVQSNLSADCLYLVDPEDISNTLNNNVVQEAVNELKVEYKDKIKEYMSKKLEEMIKR